MAWDAMLKKTDVTLDLITDPSMYQMIEGGLRGGVCMISNRYSKANNKAMGKDFVPLATSKYITYLDANNLYGWAMSQPLPYGKFEWVPPEKLAGMDWTLLQPADHEGYINECDLEYTDELHTLHNDYPLAPEKVQINVEMLSEKQVEISREYTRARTKKNVKLVPNLMKKIKYTTHYLNLKFYLEHGMKLTKVYRIIRFRQSLWMRPYIQMNTTLRAAAKKEMEKDVHKLMNNPLYGKTCENQWKRTDIRLVNDIQKAAKLLDKPHCKNISIFDENLVGIELEKVKQVLSKPSYVGFAVLELSKLHMYR